MGNGGVLVKGVKGGKPYIDISISISGLTPLNTCVNHKYFMVYRLLLASILYNSIIYFILFLTLIVVLSFLWFAIEKMFCSWYKYVVCNTLLILHYFILYLIHRFHYTIICSWFKWINEVFVIYLYACLYIFI